MKNIIFDVGNVLLKWDPAYIISCVFPACSDPKGHIQKFTTVMADTDAGKFDLNFGKQILQEQLTTNKEKIEELINVFLHSLTMLPQSIALLKHLAANTKYSVFCLTNMSCEVFAFLSQQYDFWRLFKGIVVSAEIKMAKPDPKIYHYLLDKYNLSPHECVFMDDLLDNVVTAKKMGIHGIHFTNIDTAKAELRKLGIIE